MACFAVYLPHEVLAANYLESNQNLTSVSLRPIKVLFMKPASSKLQYATQVDHVKMNLLMFKLVKIKHYTGDPCVPHRRLPFMICM